MRGAVILPPERVPRRAKRTSATRARLDVGYFQLIEAMLVGFLLLGAVFLAIGFSAPPPPSSTAGTEELEQVTWDAVESMNDLFVHDSAFSNSTLSRAVADALAGDTSALVASMREFFPPGSAFNIYLNNGFERSIVYGSREPQGQTVGISFPFEPRWNYVFTAPDLEVYDTAGTTTAMGLTMIPVHNSNLVRDGGILIEAEIAGSQSWLPGQIDKSGADLDFSDHAFTTLVQGGVQAGADYPSASIWMNCKQISLGPPPEILTVPCYALDLSAQPDQGREPEQEGRILFTVHNYGVGELPAGTEITAQFPVGLDVTDARDLPNENAWVNPRVLGAGPNPQSVKATLAEGLEQGEEAVLRVNLNKTDDRYAFKIVNARLSGTAASSSQFLLRVEAKEAGAYTGGDARVVLVSGPQPAGSATDAGDPTPPARWAVVMSMPFGEGSIDSLDLTLPNGEDVFVDASFPADFATGEGAYASGLFRSEDLSVASGSNVHWSTTNHEIGAYHFFEFQVELTTNGVFTQASPHFPRATPRPLFEAYEPMPFHSQREQGVWWREEAPRTSDLPGFGKGFIIGSSVDKQIGGRLAYRNTLVEGSTDYVLADLVVDAETQQAALKDAVRSARLTADPTIVPIGETVRITLDAEDLATYLSETVGLDDVEMVTRIYPPWGLRDRIVVHEETHESGSGLLAATYDLEVVDLNGDSVQDFIVASGDGNVYGINGLSGKLVPSATYALPEDAGVTMGAHLLARGNDGAGSDLYAVGTLAGSGRIYFLDKDVNLASESWTGDKPETGVETLGINATADFNGDGIPEIFATHTTTQGEVNAAGSSRLAIYDGATGALLPGWETLPGVNDPEGTYTAPTLVYGTATELVMGKVGPNAEDGVVTNTGMTAALGVSHVNFDAGDVMDPGTPDEIREDLEEPPAITLGIYDAGMVAATADARYAWNFTGGRFTDVVRADQVPTGGDWTGIVAGGGDGWVYGLSGQKGITPVTGFEWAGITDWHDVAMANELEGYMTSSSGILAGTRDGWTTYKPYLQEVLVGVQETQRSKVFPGVRAVDALDGAIGSDEAKISWWAGDRGLILRSDDRLDTVENLTAPGMLMNSLTVDPGGVTAAAGSLSTLDLSLVNFEDVLAISANESWFVGGGVNGTTLGLKGYIVRAIDGGDTLLVTEITCQNQLLQQLPEPCHLHSIDTDGERLWIVGDKGLVLVQDVDGDATHVDLKSGGTVIMGGGGAGKVRMQLEADQQVRIDKVSVTWVPNLNLDCMRDVKLKSELIWDTTYGAAHVTGGFVAGCGAGLSAILNTQGYKTSPVPPGTNDNTFNGVAQVLLGPFKQLNDPIVGHLDGDGLKGYVDTLFVTVTFADTSQDVYVLSLQDPSLSYEDETMHFTTPVEAGFTVPATCFGSADSACGPHYDVVVEQVTGGQAFQRTSHKLCFTDAAANLVYDADDPVYISNGCDVVSSNDVRIANMVGTYGAGTQVSALDTDFGTPMLDLVGKFGYDDVDGSGDFGQGDALVVDADASASISVGDPRVSGATSATVVTSGAADIGRALEPIAGAISYDDVNGNAVYGTGERLYFDADDSRSLTVHDVQLSLAGAGTILEEPDLPTVAVGIIVGRFQEDDGTLSAQGSIVRLSGTTWTEVEPPVTTTLRGVDMNDQDPRRWVAVGLNDRVLASYDSGYTWTDMPKVYDISGGAAAPLHAVDYTHPHAPIIVGGSASGLQWVLDGYTEFGQVVTRDLTSTLGTVQEVRIDPANMLISMGAGGIARAHIDVARGDGTWARVHDGNLDADAWTAGDEAGAPDMPTAIQFTLDAPAPELKLRFTLTTPLQGFSKFSPQVMGSLELSAWTGAASAGPADAVVTVDLTDATLFESGTETLDWDSDAGTLRLLPIHNPWVVKLGNPDGADHDLVMGGSYGARVSAMDLSPDGETVYVGTEGIYAVGAVEGAAPAGWDNTLYAIDVASGEILDTFALAQFSHPNQANDPDPITFVRAYAHGVFVITQDSQPDALTAGADTPVAWHVGLDGSYDADLPYRFTGGEVVYDVEVGRIVDDEAPLDLAVALQETGTLQGEVVAIDGDRMAMLWRVKPNEKGVFDFPYDVEMDAMYGAYILETTISWQIDTEVGGPDGLIQTARVFNAFTVTPPTGKIMHSPTYNLEVITWLQDWG